MASLGKKVREMEVEAGLYWDAMQRIQVLKIVGASADDMSDAVAEIEAIHINTEWPRLRLICAAAVVSLAPSAAWAQSILGWGT